MKYLSLYENDNIPTSVQCVVSFRNHQFVILVTFEFFLLLILMYILDVRFRIIESDPEHEKVVAGNQITGKDKGKINKECHLNTLKIYFILFMRSWSKIHIFNK